jgi:hypothetical protein
MNAPKQQCHEEAKLVAKLPFRTFTFVQGDAGH